MVRTWHAISELRSTRLHHSSIISILWLCIFLDGLQLRDKRGIDSFRQQQIPVKVFFCEPFVITRIRCTVLAATKPMFDFWVHQFRNKTLTTFRDSAGERNFGRTSILSVLYAKGAKRRRVKSRSDEIIHYYIKWRTVTQVKSTIIN